MENKDVKLIRKYINLLESIETKIIVENELTDVNEDFLATAAREGKLVAPELEGFLKGMKSDTKINAELTKMGITDAEKLLAALKGNRLNSTLKGSLELNILKSQTTNAKLIDLASENLARNDKFLEVYSNEIKQGQPQFEAALKKAGFSDRAITKIVEKAYLKKPSGLQTVGSKQKDAQNIIDAGNQRRAINYNPKTGKWTITTQRLADKLKASKEGKILASNNKSLIEKIKNLFKSDAKLITDAGGVKQWKISKKLLALGLAAGGAAVLYYLFSTKGDGSDVELVDNSDKPIDPNLVNNKKQSIYKDCVDFPYVFGCRGPIIKEVQICLGMESKYQTGNFGEVTLKYLETMRGEKEITKEVYDSIKKNCKQGVVPTGSTTGDTVTVTGDTVTTTGDTVTTTGDTVTPTGETPKPTDNTVTPTGGTTPTGESGGELYARLNADGILGPRVGDKSVIVYKGPNLPKEDMDKLVTYLQGRGFRLSRFNNDYRKGDKLVFKKEPQPQA